MSVYCVYALVSPSARTVRASGLRAERLRRVHLAGIDAIVGSLRGPPRPTRDALRRYDRVVRELAVRHTSILPARFGTCVADLRELDVALGARGDRLRARLRLVRGRVQMTLRFFRGSGRGQIGVRSGSDREYRVTQKSGTTGAQYLRRRAAETAIPGFDPLRGAVRRWVKAERIQHHDRGRLIASVYHLIPRASADRYRRAVERAARAADVTMIVTGPWPPYAFADAGW